MLSCLDSTYHQSVRYMGTQGLLPVLSMTYTVSQVRQGQYDGVSSQKPRYQDLLHMFRPNLGIGLGLFERLNLLTIFSELKSLTLLPTTFEDPYSLLIRC